MIINPYRYAAAPADLLTGLQHFWDLGGDTLADYGGVDLTDSGTATSAGTAPDGGDCREFSSGDKITAAAGNVWNSGSATTVALWTYLDVFGQNPGVVSHKPPNGYTMLQYLANTQNLRIWVDAGYQGDVTSTGAYQNWVSLVLSSTTGGADHVFINGVLKKTGSGGWEPGSAVFNLGATQLGTAVYVGKMVSCGIWDYAWGSSTDLPLAFHNAGVNLRYADLT